ncbi:ABC transporter substrate-binding protein [Photobacterium aphoticum]|uniref:(GlcNAc)2 ABC transporter periplasmic substrate-binding protein n=1 Tax=Photobacterium aphoticum TaxID=754436 RepID=A0A090QRT9_9GAMM|nr:ABC transporter substrate-binding protein [Photobacterium aphoticum]KLV00814.1 peptide ABC transporter substrate-binding protein [Photobacterium aphoticum]PSU54640.1 ABC transporter substrate-binding protein [Photobacterium aphoticum]GAL05895.1 (GlcNAc)2 ABC transporter periplasmic substrate-binding protein [Photobacterium aphoticum]GHA51369.1 peptide ABC transporter substrate-binding protein [Photobacterium aphoticum]
MLANIKKTQLAMAVVAAAASALTAPVVSAAERSELTIVPQFYPTMVRNFNPFLDTSLHTTTEFMYEPLVIFNQMHGNEPVMRLAKDYYMSDDLMQVTFEMRDGLKWSDGKPLTAHDVAYTIELLQSKPELDRTGVNAWVKSAKVQGNKVIFDLTEATSNAPFEIAKVSFVPKHIWSKVKNPESFANENPVGSGAFTAIDTFTPQLYIQCQNPYYWDKSNLEVDCLRMPQIAGNDQLLAKVINSELDWTSSFIPDIDSTYAAANPNHKYWYPAAGTQSFMMNFKSPNKGNHEAINNVDFRRAFSMAIDRQTIIDIAFYGNGSPNDYASGLGDAHKSWSDPKVYNKYKGFNTYNVKNAKALLKKAGFKDVNGDGFVETPTGKEIVFEIISPNGWTDFNNTVQLGVEQLQEVGINAKARTPDFAIYNKAMQDGTYDVAYTNYFLGADPHTYWNDGYNSALQEGEGKPRFAMHHFKNAELDKLLNSFYKTADRKEQLAIAHGIQKIIAENQITIPVMTGAFNFQYNTTRFDGWWNENNPKGRPMIWAGVQERVLQVLDLKPKS